MSERIINKARLIPCCSTSNWITTYGFMEIIIRFILLGNQVSILRQLKLTWDFDDLFHSFNGNTRGCPIGGLYYSKMDTLVATVLNIIDLVMIFLLLAATRMRILRMLKMWLVFAFGMTILCFIMAVAKNCSPAILFQLFYMAYIMVLASGVSSLVHEIEAEIRSIKSLHHHHRHRLPETSSRDDTSRTHQLTPHVITMSTLPMFSSSSQAQRNHHENAIHTVGFEEDPAPPPPYENFQPPPYAQITNIPRTNEKLIKKFADKRCFDGLA